MIESPDRYGHWITAAEWQADPDGPLPVVGCVFSVADQPREAAVSVAGLGVFNAKINGQPVSPDLLEPGYTDYAQRTEWCAYDVLGLIRPGRNVITIELGPGCYRSRPAGDRWTKIITNYGDLGACASLHWSDAGGIHMVATDTDWHACLGPVRQANWVGGEDYDDRHAIDLAKIEEWPAAAPARMPLGLTLTRKTIPPLRVIEELAPVTINTVGHRRQVIDLGVNFAGWVELDLPAATSVRVTPAELLQTDGNIDPPHPGLGSRLSPGDHGRSTTQLASVVHVQRSPLPGT